MRRFVKRRTIAGFALALCAAAAALWVGRALERRSLERAARDAGAKAQARLEKQSAVLGAAAAWMADHPSARAAELRAFAAGLPWRGAGLAGLGFSRSFRRGETGQVEGELRQQGLSELRVWPDSGREQRSAVVWLEPERRPALGFDLLVDPARRSALERARDTGAAALLAKTALDEGRGPAGQLLCVPAYRGRPASLDERRAALLGWIFGARPEEGLPEPSPAPRGR